MRLLPALCLCAAVLPCPADAAPRPRGEIVTVVHRPATAIPTLGPHLAPVTIDFFFDPTNSISLRFHRIAEVMVGRHPRRLRVRYRMMYGRGDRNLAVLEAGHEAAAQGRFFQFIDAYMNAPIASVNGKDLEKIAQDAELDMDRMRAALVDHRHESVIRADQAFSKRYRARMFPSMLANGVPYAGHEAPMVSESAFEAIYDEALDRARTLEERGVPMEDLYPALLRQAASDRPVPRVSAGPTDGSGSYNDRASNHGKRATRLPSATAAEVRGPDNAPVVIDFFCRPLSQKCRQLSANLAEIRESYPDEVRMVFHPVVPDRKDDEDGAIRRILTILLCTADQDAGLPLLDEALGSVNPRLDEFLTAVVDRGVDAKRLAVCMDDKTKGVLLEAAAADARKSGIVQIPSMVIGGRIVVGAQPFEAIRDLIDQELAAGVLGGMLPVRQR